MRKFTILFCLMLLALPLSQNIYAQDTPNLLSSKAPDAAKPAALPVHYYHLEFSVQQISPEGKLAPPSTYTTTVSTDSSEPMSIRADSKVPILAGSWLGVAKENQQVSYQDIGVHIDARDAHETGGKLTFNLIAELTTLAAPTNPDIHQYVIRQNRWQAWVLIPVGKPTTVFTSDDFYNKGGVQILVTATLLQ